MNALVKGFARLSSCLLGSVLLGVLTSRHFDSGMHFYMYLDGEVVLCDWEFLGDSYIIETPVEKGPLALGPRLRRLYNSDCRFFVVLHYHRAYTLALRVSESIGHNKSTVRVRHLQPETILSSKPGLSRLNSVTKSYDFPGGRAPPAGVDQENDDDSDMDSLLDFLTIGPPASLGTPYSLQNSISTAC